MYAYLLYWFQFGLVNDVKTMTDDRDYWFRNKKRLQINPGVSIQVNTDCHNPECDGIVEKANIPSNHAPISRISYKCNKCGERSTTAMFNIIDNRKI